MARPLPNTGVALSDEIKKEIRLVSCLRKPEEKRIDQTWRLRTKEGGLGSHPDCRCLDYTAVNGIFSRSIVDSEDVGLSEWRRST